MDVQVKQLPKSRVRIEVSVSWEEWKKELDHAREAFVRQTRIEGFRPGKAPKEMVERKVGKGAILAEAAEHALRATYARVLKEQHIDAIGRPEASLDRFEEGGALVYSVETAILPVISLGNWERSVRKVNAKFFDKKPDVSEEAVEKAINRLAERRAEFVVVDREARKGDTVEIDFVVSREGVPIEGGTARKYHLVLGSEAFIPGFEDRIVGMRAGEDRTFELAFPEKYHDSNLAGKLAQFEVSLRAVKERDLPVIDDAFAVTLGDFTNLEALRKSIREGLVEEAEEAQHGERQNALIEALIENVKTELPDILVDEEVGKMIAEFESKASSMGATLDDVLTQTAKSREDFEKEMRPQAEHRVLASLAIATVADDRGIEPPQKEIEEEMNRALQHIRTIRQAESDVDLARLHSFALERLRHGKTMELLESLK